MSKKNVNRNIAEALAEEQNAARAEKAKRKQVSRSKAREEVTYGIHRRTLFASSN